MPVFFRPFLSAVALSMPHTTLVSGTLRRLGAGSRRAPGARAVREAIVSLAGLLGGRVLNQSGEEVGRVVDVVVRLHGEDRYPPVTGLVVRIGRRRTYVDAATIAALTHRAVTLGTARLDMRDFARRPGEVLLACDLLDHQLVDVDGVQVIRAADLYMAPVGGQIRLVGVDVSLQTLLRRLGPRRLRGRPTPDRVIDWDAIAPFTGELVDGSAGVRLRGRQDALHRLRPGELADLLEDLGRPGRQELLARLEPGTAADALEEMDPEELHGLLRESEPHRAAELVAAMEPDEAVDALRDLSHSDRDDLLRRMPGATGVHLRRLLSYPEDRAAGFMTTVLVVVGVGDTVAEVCARLGGWADHANEIDAVVVCDEHGAVLGDVPLFGLLTAPGERTMGALLRDGPHASLVVVGPLADVHEVAASLVESRRSSLLVLDDDRRPLGRILADDVLDALSPETGRLHFPRLLR